MSNDPLIKIWRFKDAPEIYRNLSTNGGDEDWVVVMSKPEFLITDEKTGESFLDYSLYGLFNSFYHDYINVNKMFVLEKEVVLIFCHA